MKAFRNFSVLSIFFVMVLLGACKKEKVETEQNQKESYKTLSFSDSAIENRIPEGLKSSEDVMASLAYAWLSTATDWTYFTYAIEPPEDAVNIGENTLKWAWNFGSYNYSMFWAFTDDDSKNYWNIDIEYITDEKFNYMEAWEAKDGKSGEVKYNFAWACQFEEENENCDDIYWKYSWEVDANNTYKYSYTLESEDDDIEYDSKYEMELNEDGSGILKYYVYGDLYYEMMWDEEGNGNYTQYSEGEEIDSGEWTAGQ